MHLNGLININREKACKQKRIALFVIIVADHFDKKPRLLLHGSLMWTVKLKSTFKNNLIVGKYYMQKENAAASWELTMEGKENLLLSNVDGMTRFSLAKWIKIDTFIQSHDMEQIWRVPKAFTYT